MMDREIDASIAEEASRIMEEAKLEERLYELEQRVVSQQDTINQHALEKERWDRILMLAGAQTVMDLTTFSMENSTELVADDHFVHYTSKELGRLARKGLDFEAILEGIEANETLKSQWSNLLMTMRMYHKEPGDE